MGDVKTWLNSQEYKNLFPDTTRDSILEVITLRSSLSIYTFTYTLKFYFSELVLLTAHEKILSKQPLYIQNVHLMEQNKVVLISKHKKLRMLHLNYSLSF
jgi:hypothetical protein